MSKSTLQRARFTTVTGSVRRACE